MYFASLSLSFACPLSRSFQVPLSLSITAHLYNIWVPPLPSTTNITSNYVSKQNFILRMLLLPVPCSIPAESNIGATHCSRIFHKQIFDFSTHWNMKLSPTHRYCLYHKQIDSSNISNQFNSTVSRHKSMILWIRRNTTASLVHVFVWYNVSNMHVIHEKIMRIVRIRSFIFFTYHLSVCMWL